MVSQSSGKACKVGEVAHLAAMKCHVAGATANGLHWNQLIDAEVLAHAALYSVHLLARSQWIP